MVAPQFVAVGHVSFDIHTDPGADPTPTRGGAAAYAALTAQALGMTAGVVTSAADNYPFDEVLPGVPHAVTPSRDTTTFRDVTVDSVRCQTLAACAADITAERVPESWRNPQILFLGPLAGEMPLDCAAWFSAGLTCVVPQGWQRTWDDDGHISVAPEPPAGVEGRWNIAVVSEADVPAGMELEWLNLADTLVITRGDRGAGIHSGGRWYEAEAIKADVVDTTGAGDVWAAAFAVTYAETGDVQGAARLACAASALTVEQYGLAGIAGREQIEQRTG